VVRFGIAMPQVSAGGPTDVAALHRFLRRAEDLGFESAWVLEQPVGHAAVLEPVTLLAHAAAVTERIRLGTAVILLPLKIPVDLARTLATVDQLSGGRLIAGLALGAWQDRYPAFGLSADGRVRRFEEAVRLLKLLWTERGVTFDGEFWQLDDVTIGTRPIQQPHPPIWFGGNMPKAVQRAARMADGWMGAGSSRTADFADARRVLAGALEAEGRDPDGFEVAKRVYIAVDDDAERAHLRLREGFGLFYGNPDMADRVAVWGPVDACVEGLAAVVEAGARMIALNPMYEHAEQAEVLAAGP
jgi:probable F420-dependent oxidoreductase